MHICILNVQVIFEEKSWVFLGIPRHQGSSAHVKKQGSAQILRVTRVTGSQIITQDFITIFLFRNNLFYF